jgi:hypothetical protein
MFLSVSLGLASVALTVLVHNGALQQLSRIARVGRGHRHILMLVVIFCAFAAHLIEVGVYAATYWIGDVVLHLGRFAGNGDGDAFNYFYFSLESFTSLGMGDIYPLGDLRLIAGVESLNGILLIAWSASFTYLMMERFWTFDGVAKDTKLHPADALPAGVPSVSAPFGAPK